MGTDNHQDKKKKINGKVAGSGTERDFWGFTCILVGALFAVIALFLFVFSNRMNFFAQKTSATVIARSDIETDTGEQRQMLTVMYHVGNENVVSTYEYGKGILSEDVVSIDIYYNVKNPNFIIEDGWSFYAIPVFVLGILILLIGLCIKGYILQELHLFEDTLPKSATKYQREVFEVKKKSFENLFPFSAAILMLLCGIVFLITKAGWGAYIFIGLGALAGIYVGLELFPTLYEWYDIHRKYKMSQIKGKVIDIETNILPEEEKKDS